MARRRSRVTLAVFIGCLSMGAVGCASEVFGPEWNVFIRDTIKETTVAIGNFIVNGAITSRFD